MALTTRFRPLCALLLLALAVLPARADEAGKFDFYVLALSWSPTYCKQEGPEREPPSVRCSKPVPFHRAWPLAAI